MLDSIQRFNTIFRPRLCLFDIEPNAHSSSGCKLYDANSIHFTGKRKSESSHKRVLFKLFWFLRSLARARDDDSRYVLELQVHSS